MASATQSEKVPETVQEVEQKPQPLAMQSIARVMNFPVVKEAAKFVQQVYIKIKENHSKASRTLTSAESIVKTAVDKASPFVASFQKPIEKVDKILCSGLDLVETKIPAVNMPAAQVYDLVNTTKTKLVQNFHSIQEYSTQKITNNVVVSKTRQAFMDIKPYLSYATIQQNFNVYAYIAKKIYDLFPEVPQEMNGQNVPEREKSSTKEQKKTETEPQTEKESQPEPEGTTVKPEKSS